MNKDISVLTLRSLSKSFGGVQAVAFGPRTGEFEAAGDPRRGGVGLVVAE